MSLAPWVILSISEDENDVITPLVCTMSANIELLISAQNNKHLSVNDFVTVGQSPWNVFEIENNHVKFNSLRPSDAYMRRETNHHWFRYWLVAWTAPSHYLNSCWNIVNWILRNKFPWNFNRYSNIFIQENAFENGVCEMASILSRPRCVKMWRISPEFFKVHSIELNIIFWAKNQPSFFKARMNVYNMCLRLVLKIGVTPF